MKGSGNRGSSGGEFAASCGHFITVKGGGHDCTIMNFVFPI